MSAFTDKDLAIYFGATMEERRKAMHMSRKELADAARISFSAVYAYERGDAEPTAHVIVDVSKALKTNPNHMLGFDGVDE